MGEVGDLLGAPFGFPRVDRVEERLDKLEELVLAMGEVMATKHSPFIGSFKRKHDGDLDLAARLFDELKARRAARKETDDETAS